MPRFMAFLLVLLFSQQSQAAEKGLGMWGTPGIKGSEVGARWYYNWYSSPTMGDGGNLEFVPMIWQTFGGQRGPSQRNLDEVKRQPSPYLLGFNEPDNCGMGGTCSSVDAAIASWPALMSTGKILGSPSVAGNYGWLEDFMAKAQARGYRVDFMAVHIYPNWSRGAGGAQHVKDLLTWVHDRYQRPIWLTEFGTCDYGGGRGSNEDAQAFIREVIPMLNAMPFVERYAWFSDRSYSGCNQSAIWNGWGLSPTGQAYRDAG